MMPSNRRTFLRQTATAAATAPFFVRNLISKPPSSTVRVASFGGDGMAYYTLDGIGRHPKVTLVCVAEVDSARTEKVKQKYSGAKLYQDWREMMAKEKGNLDAACVGTPDHMHAPMAMCAMRNGLPVYCQKPLAHNIHEVRRLTEYARKKNLPTQMGIQVHSNKEYKTAVKLMRAGAIGKVKEVHSWSEKKWGDTEPLPNRTDTPPASLNWDAWTGVAAPRPFIAEVYHPMNWRKRVDFGTATFGDMGCHIIDPVFDSLALTAPISVRSEGPAPNAQSWALNSVIRYVFPATPYTDGKTLPVSWYDGDERPPAEVLALLGTVKVPGQGSIFIGTKGVMLLPHIAMPVLLPEKDFAGFEMPKEEPVNHYFQWVDAVMGNGKASAPFEYAGPLTEAVLLGPLATHFPKATLEWNSAKMKFRNAPQANAFLARTYRQQWSTKGI
ncbi:MAG TPA: Gfo/Idh/MocA family oxidoreductase [Candidatus Acidoferrum sp.]|nr:Gfo/Idh/MocA family oxidoreductase [Candidatus Acidoferrum sp.]